MKTLEPIAVINGTIAIIEAAIALLAATLLKGKLNPEVVGYIMALVIAVGNLIKTRVARRQVTPVIDPRDSQGNHLVPSVSN